MDLSFIIVNWNTRDLILKCIESIKNDTMNMNIEIIVVDNYSNDDSVACIRSAYPEVRLICNKSNLGFAKANNIGLKASTGNRIALVNSDVQILKGCIPKMVLFLDRNPSVGLVGPKALNADLSLQATIRRFPSILDSFLEAFGIKKIFLKSKVINGEFVGEIPQDLPVSVDVLYGCFWLTSREALERVGFLDERFFIYGEDIDWCKRYHNMGYKIIYYPDAEIIHYGGSSSGQMPNKFYLEMQKARSIYWAKYGDQGARLCAWFIMFIHHFIRMCLFCFLIIFFINQKSLLKSKIARNFYVLSWMVLLISDKFISIKINKKISE